MSHRAPFILLTAVMLLTPISVMAGEPATRINWDRSTLMLLQQGGAYARMTRVGDGLLCCFEHRGRCFVRHSVDEGKTWQDAIEAAAYEFGTAANPELLYCGQGRVLLFFNQRPNDHLHPYAIASAMSRDNGRTWVANSKPLYSAGPALGQGCYEPSAIQLSSGEVQLFFANEYPHRADGTQEISLLRSKDTGATWQPPIAVSYRAGHRDGMPVPIVLLNHRGMAFAIEDNGVTTDREFKPTIIHSPSEADWGQPAIGADSAWRWGAVDGDWPGHVYAGAPYLRQLPGGETLLSCQSSHGTDAPKMVIYIGDADAKHFGNPTEPFTGQTRGMWNSLFVKNAETVTAISGTTINGQRGVWAIDGHVVRGK
jgi:hypothetical protein